MSPPQVPARNRITESHRSTLNSVAIQDLRARILQHKCCRKCSQADLMRLRREDWWLVSFLRTYNYDIDITYAVLAECIQWRTNFQVESEFGLPLYLLTCKI
ncbi:unnamed protein product [Heligmosomoides polygyrus]|uniref:CRAL_TRIO_N domain-containing protein n=1 Tax=Heligmosomoides polygyrus TaxID=6339 RepID=A0A3P8DY57_HELPZ|nr:unnamed protein product [Heligmosomoides polygyrus]